MDRTFGLAPSGSRRGISCQTDGAYIGNVPLLTRSQANGRGHWEPRECAALSHHVSTEFGVPIDLSSKMKGLKAIARALNEGDVARAQVAAVLLGIPDPPPRSASAQSRVAMIKLIRELAWSGLIKNSWDPDEHPRWPAGASDGRYLIRTTTTGLRHRSPGANQPYLGGCFCRGSFQQWVYPHSSMRSRSE